VNLCSFLVAGCFCSGKAAAWKAGEGENGKRKTEKGERRTENGMIK
jgi:hypothetical protein